MRSCPRTSEKSGFKDLLKLQGSSMNLIAPCLCPFRMFTVKHRRKPFVTTIFFTAIVFLGLLVVQRKGNFRSFRPDIEYRLQGPLSPFDENLIREVRERYLVPPSHKPYNLELFKESNVAKQYTNEYQSEEWQNMNKEIRALFPPGEKSHGFFIEAGAFDGEFWSNSLYLELELGWGGLLIEPIKEEFLSLLQKNRKAWSCHCCLSTRPYPHKTVLSKIISTKMTDAAPDKRKFYSSISESTSNKIRNGYGFSVYENVQCLPLETILLAINQTHVNLVTLDIEDVEVDFLKHFAWDKIDVDVWIVEHRNPKFGLQKNVKDPEFIRWFESKGYVFYKMTPFLLDYIFIRKKSVFFKNNRQRLGIQES